MHGKKSYIGMYRLMGDGDPLLISYERDGMDQYGRNIRIADVGVPDEEILPATEKLFEIILDSTEE